MPTFTRSNLSRIGRSPSASFPGARSASRFKRVGRLPPIQMPTLQVAMKTFLDRESVVSAMTKKERSALTRIGGWIRTTMKRSMRPATIATPHSPSGPLGIGKPPRYHSKLLRNMIFFYYDATRHSVIVGPTLVPTNPDVKPIGKTIPQLLDEGGTAYGKRQLVIKDRYRNRLISVSSKAGRKIMRSKQFQKTKNSATTRAQGIGYHFMYLKPGPRRFKGNPFKVDAFQKSITEAKLKSAWAVVS